MLSSSLISSFVSGVPEVQRRLSASCAMLLAPTITEVTPSCASTQRRASVAGVSSGWCEQRARDVCPPPAARPAMWCGRPPRREHAAGPETQAAGGGQT